MMQALEGVSRQHKAAQTFLLLTPLILTAETCFLILNCPSFENNAISRFFNLCYVLFFLSFVIINVTAHSIWGISILVFCQVMKILNLMNQDISNEG